MTLAERIEKPARPPLPPAEPDTAGLRDLVARDRWVLWRYTWAVDKWTKVPHQPSGRKASSTAPATWSSYATARAAAERGSFDGVGYVVYRGPLVEPDDIVGIDLDHCIDPVTNQLTPEADAIVEELSSYTELTPSGTGVRIYVRATLPVDGGKRGDTEMYQNGRYFTVTGQHLDWTPPEIRERQEVTEAVYHRIFGQPVTRATVPASVQSSAVTMTDDELLRRMFAAENGPELRELYDGSNGVYPSGSEGDLRLCGALSFWTARDAGRIDRLFRGSRRTRAKWDESHRSDGTTYGQMTVDKAILGTTDVYEPSEYAPALNGRIYSADEDDPEPPSTPSYGKTRPWPAPMGQGAFTGLAGDTVRALQPYTEADPHGLLISVLTAFGCMLNSGPYLLHGSTMHWPRLFSLVVGGTGDGRKGESWSPVRRLILAVDPSFRARMQGGLSSGEGLIYAVRDPIHGVVKGESVLIDEGVSDKRLLVYEAEFSRVLTVLNRDTNTLGAIVRDAWDTGDLSVMTKTPARATAAHICTVGHVTPDELVANCDQAWITNGFLNRFLVGMVKRSQLLPIPRALDGNELDTLAKAWRVALDVARPMGRVNWSNEGREWWMEKYSSFLTSETGKLGAMKVRAAPMVLRLALTYALMDGARLITPVHLDAAEEVWRYSERSIEHLFGESTGNATADIIHSYLRKELEMRKSKIHQIFSRHKEVHELDAALTVLEQAGLAYRKYTVPKGGGKVETWYLQE